MNVLDLAARRREQDRAGDDGTVLSVVPVPGGDAALVIVAYTVPLDSARLPAAQPAQSVQSVRGPRDLLSGAVPDVVLDAVRELRPAGDTENTGNTGNAGDRGHAGEAGDAASRRPRRPRPEDDLVVDRVSRVVRVDGEEIDLTYREFELLDYLCSAPGRVYNRRQLLAAVWDRYGEEGARTVDVHILRLRRKLGRFADRIVTMRNVGYKYQPPRPR